MIVYRICKAKYAKAAFSGAGGLESPGRWHRKGQLIVYAASTLSLAALEYFVHLGRTDSKIAFVVVHAIIADDLAMDVVDPASLPKDWNSSPPIDATMDFGTQWCLDVRGVVIKVPSAVVQGEFNYLLNPQHPDFKLIKISTPERFSFVHAPPPSAMNRIKKTSISSRPSVSAAQTPRTDLPPRWL